jgi:eukaryotic-like serine/threonine-protein kinase
LFSAGQIVGNYQILSKLGTGGMGAVYLAEHPLIGKKVALKVIHRELSGNREVVQRFFQEARAVNTIGHEHIVEIHDFGQTPEGDHFYIMEYLDGITLAQAIARERRLEVRRALHISAQIAGGLAATHAAGVIHRDLKPDNVMLMPRMGSPDFVKILDFGLAKVLAGNGTALTAFGVVLGTPQYMSPEACESKRDVDHRTDIYALGVLLFQMLTGTLPFDGNSMGEVLVKQVTQLPPAPRGFNPEIPPSVEQILLRCLAKAPAGRFQSMEALREALLSPEAYLASSPPMSAARSVAPGESKTLMAMVPPRPGTGDLHHPRPGTDQAGGLGHARTVALPAAGPATGAHLVSGGGPTMMLGPEHGGGAPSGMAGAAPAPVPAAQARTMMAPGLGGVPHPQGNPGTGPHPMGPHGMHAMGPGVPAAPSQARTMMAPGLGAGAAMGQGHGAPAPGYGGYGGPPGQGAPQPPPMPSMNIENRTMIIATPVGHISTPPRRRWRLITAVAALSLLAGTAILLLTRDGSPGQGAPGAAAEDAGAVDAGHAMVDAGAMTVPAIDAPPLDAPPAIDAAAAGPDAGAAASGDAGPSGADAGTGGGEPAVAGAELTIDSVPEGASIWIAGAERGVAPLTLRFDSSTKKLTVEARKSGYASKKQTLVLEGKMSVQFNLQKKRERDDRRPTRPTRPTRPSRPKQPGNDLMRPDA